MTKGDPEAFDNLIQREFDRLQARREAMVGTAEYERKADLESWHFCDELSVNRAALLIVGVSPSSNEGQAWLAGNYPDKIGRLDAVQTSMMTAILGGRLKATIRFPVRHRGADEAAGVGELMARMPITPPGGDPPADDIFSLPPGRPVESLIVTLRPDWDETTVMVDDLRAWLRSKGMTTGFFFEPAPARKMPGYLDPSHERYALKLAAAVRAWEAVTDAGNRSPKTALRKWLNERAALLGLTLKDGKPNSKAVEEAATVANWKPEGGAPKTRG